MASGLNKPLEGFALATLGRAAGQDFLSGSLEDTRARDRFVFQQQRAEQAIAKERARRGEERRNSRRGLLNAFVNTGAISQTDLVAAGGLDALAELEDSEFALVSSQMSNRQMERLDDEQFLAALNGKLGALGKPLLPKGTSRTQAIEVDSRVEMERLQIEEQRSRQGEVLGEFDRSIAAMGEQFAAAAESPESVNTGWSNKFEGGLQALRARVGNSVSDLGYENAQSLLQRIDTLSQQGQRLQIVGMANDYGRFVANSPISLMSTWSGLDPALREKAINHPSITPIVADLQRNIDALAAMTPEQAARAQLAGAHAALGDKRLAEDLLLNPEAAAQVFRAKVQQGQSIVQAEESKELAQAAAETAVQAANANFAGMGLGGTAVDPSLYMVTTTGANGTITQFNAEKFEAAVAEELTNRELTEEQAVLVLRHKGAPPALYEKAVEKLTSLHADGLTSAIDNLKVQEARHMRIIAEMLTKATEGVGDDKYGVVAGPQFKEGRFLDFTAYYNDPLPITESQVQKLHATTSRLWSLNDQREEASSLLNAAQRELAEFTGLGPVEAALSANVAEVATFKMGEDIRHQVKNEAVSGALKGLSGGGAGLLTSGNRQLTYGDKLNLTSLPSSATDLATQMRIAASPELFGLDDPTLLFAYHDALADFESVAKAIDDALGDEDTRTAVYRGLGRTLGESKPKWFDDKDKVAAYLLLDTFR